jgi:uncharacterized lipoprotein YddW (UPF0748 family)
MTPSRTTTRLLSLAMIAGMLTLSACSSIRKAEKSEPGVPDVPREFRAVWVATVANIDWPSEPGLSTQDQQDELIAILDRCKVLNFNAVVLQVRPAADALYPSDLEPWSYFLTGEMGAAPQPHYDPLAFAVQEAHRRGLELHAWFNPYRALHPSNKGDVADSHISKTRPSVVHEYGPYLWMNPSEPAVQAHSLAVMLDVVRRYDVDGIHMDDYFYPYKVNDDEGNEVDFPDDAAWRAYLDAGGKLGRSDWRRKSVDDFIERLYRETKKIKPHVQVGISPFGIWTVRGPVRRCQEVAEQGLGGLLHAAAVLGDRQAGPELHRPAPLVGRREQPEPSPLAGHRPLPHGQPVRRDGDPVPDQVDAYHHAGRPGLRALLDEGVHGR